RRAQPQAQPRRTDGQEQGGKNAKGESRHGTRRPLSIAVMRWLLLVLVFPLLAACAQPGPFPDAQGAQAVLLGEQHDADLHRRLQREWVTALARQGALATLALEMAE